MPSSLLGAALALPWHVARLLASRAARADVVVRAEVDRIRSSLVAFAEGWRGHARAAAHAVWSLACGRVLGEDGDGLTVHATGTFLRDGAGCSRREAYALRTALAEVAGATLGQDGYGPRAPKHLRTTAEARTAAAEASLELHRRGLLAEPLRGGGTGEGGGELADLGPLAPGRHTIRCPFHEDRSPSLHLLLRRDGTGGALCRASGCGVRLALRPSGSGRTTGILVEARSRSERAGTSTEGEGRASPSAAPPGGWTADEVRGRASGLATVVRRRTGDRALPTRDLLVALREAERHALSADEEDAWVTVDAQDFDGRDPKGRARWRRGHVRWVMVDLDGERGPGGDAWAAGLAEAVREVLSGRADLGPVAAPLLDDGRPWSGRAAIVRTSPGGLHVLAELRRAWTPDAVGRGGILRPLVEALAMAAEGAARAVGFDATWDRGCAGAATRRPGWRTLASGEPFRVELVWSAGPSEVPKRRVRPRREARSVADTLVGASRSSVPAPDPAAVEAARRRWEASCEAARRRPIGTPGSWPETRAKEGRVRESAKDRIDAELRGRTPRLGEEVLGWTWTGAGWASGRDGGGWLPDDARAAEIADALADALCGSAVHAVRGSERHHEVVVGSGASAARFRVGTVDEVALVSGTPPPGVGAGVRRVTSALVRGEDPYPPAALPHVIGLRTGAAVRYLAAFATHLVRNGTAAEAARSAVVEEAVRISSRPRAEVVAGAEILLARVEEVARIKATGRPPLWSGPARLSEARAYAARVAVAG